MKIIENLRSFKYIQLRKYIILRKIQHNFTVYHVCILRYSTEFTENGSNGARTHDPRVTGFVSNVTGRVLARCSNQLSYGTTSASTQ